MYNLLCLFKNCLSNEIPLWIIHDSHASDQSKHNLQDTIVVDHLTSRSVGCGFES